MLRNICEKGPVLGPTCDTFCVNAQCNFPRGNCNPATGQCICEGGYKGTDPFSQIFRHEPTGRESNRRKDFPILMMGIRYGA